MHMNAQNMYTCAICSNNCTGYHGLQKHFKRVHTQHELKNIKRKAEEFTFSEGCAEVLLSKRIKSRFLAEGLDTVPSKITLKNDNNEFNFFSLLNKTSMGVLGNLGLVNKSISCTIKAHTEENLENEATPPIPFNPSELNLSKLPLFEKKLGAYYVAITEDIETRINSDLSDFNLAANLFDGCLLYVENLIVCCATIEVYGREFSNDVHAERFKVSYPELIDHGDRYYNGIKTLVIEEKNGKQTMKKLIIGTTQFNLLVTCTILLSDPCDQFVSVGPLCHQSLHYSNLQ